MIPKTAILKALEGGWKAGWGNMDTFTPKVAAEQLDLVDWQWIALDPAFWTALGKALGWEANDKEHGRQGELWRSFAIRFYDLILTNQPTDQFWADLLK